MKNDVQCLSDAVAYCRAELKRFSDSPFLEAQLIVAFVLGISKESLYISNDEKISEDKLEEIVAFVEKRRNGTPFYYLVGKREFMGLEFKVNESVLIPRPETETLVEKAIEIADGRSLTVLDVGTGSGCILLSFVKYNGSSVGTGIDISEKSISVAEENARNLALSNRVKFIATDFRNFFSKLKFDMILSNPPYVKTRNLIHLKHEPLVALDGGIDGFELYVDLIRKAFRLLKNGGYFIVEIDDCLSAKTFDSFKKEGFLDIEIIPDLADKKRFVAGWKK